jgi:2,4-dienoyl-CoA reductase-like NADH-dependent reductase (Old Yellow Enzyme family)
MARGMDGTFLHEDNAALIFSPLQFRHLTVKNRLFRSNLSGMFDEYNGYGGHTRLNWEEKFARGGVGAIISSYTPVAVRGRILIRYAMIDDDDKIPFWREVGKRVHDYDCRFLMQLSHSGGFLPWNTGPGHVRCGNPRSRRAVRPGRSPRPGGRA